MVNFVPSDFTQFPFMWLVPHDFSPWKGEAVGTKRCGKRALKFAAESCAAGCQG